MGYEKIVKNLKNEQHTLSLLDIKVKERTVENMMRGKNIFDPPRFMSTQQAAKQLMEIVKNRKTSEDNNHNGETSEDVNNIQNLLDENSICIAVARIGSEDQKLVASSLQNLKDIDMGPPLHSLIISSSLHHIEKDFIDTYTIC